MKHDILSLRPLQRFACIFSFLLIGQSLAGTINPEYSSNSYNKATSRDYTLSIPTLHGVQLPKIKGVVINAPGVGGNYAIPVNPRWEKFLYEHGFAYFGIDGQSSAPQPYYTLQALGAFASDNLDGNTYPELVNVPVFYFGESYGGESTIGMTFEYPERTIAFLVEHSRNLWGAVASVTDPVKQAALKTVPGYYRWGEWDNERFNDGYHDYSSSVYGDKLANGMQIMCVLEPRQEHATKRYSIEEAMGYLGLILDSRYDYQEGVAGKDPSLGPVTLTEIPYTDGYLGEHIINGIQTDGPDDGSSQDDNIANFMKDWESSDPYYAPYNSFERSDKIGHSWIANETLGAFWASKFAYGRNDLKTDFIDLLNDDLGGETVTAYNSMFPNYFLTGQDIRVEVSAWDFANLDRIEFYANEQLMGTVQNAPYKFTYNFSAGQEGMYALYAVAIASDGHRSVGLRRMVQVYPNTRAGNTAPTVSNIGVVSGLPGETISVPFLIGDTETSADALTVSWSYINRTSTIADSSYYITTSGTGAERDLQMTLPSQAGILWGIVQVSDGDMSTNAYVQINVTGDGSEPPFFVSKEAISYAGPIYTHDAWTRRISVHIYDYDTDAADLTLTATASSPANLPSENIRVGGAGRFRYVQLKPLGGTNVTISLSDGNTTVTKSFYVGLDSQDNQVPRISDIPDQTASYSNTVDPIEVRVYDLHTPSEPLTPSDTELALSVVSDNQSLIPDGSINISSVGPRRHITFKPANGQTGTATLTATVTDEGGLTASDSFTVTVGAPPALSASAATLDAAIMTQSYSAQMKATGGIEPYSYSHDSGNLPPGLTLLADGSLSGTPTQTGTFTFTVQVADAESTTDTETYTLVVNPYVIAPTDFTATSESNTTITLTWTDTAVGETGYEIQRRHAGDYTWSTLTTTAADATSYNDSASLDFGQIYEYRIRAVGSVDGAFSSSSSAAAVAMPVINTQPDSAGVLPLHTAVLSINASGGNLSYQWYEGSAGDTSTPLTGAISESLSVNNVLGDRSFWVRVSNGAGHVDSTAATVGVSMASPSLRINLGSDAGANWNSYTNYSLFAGGTTYTDDTLLYDNGSEALGLSMTITRTLTNEPFCDYFSTFPLAAYTGDWLNDTAASSAWGMGLEGYSLTFEITGLPAGTYDIEAYAYASSTTPSDNDGSTYPPYKLDSSSMNAGVLGTASTTNSDFSSALFDAEDHGTELLKWTTLTVSDGGTLELTASAAEYFVLNAFAIKGVQLAKPEIGMEPSNQNIQAGEPAVLEVLAFGNGDLHYQWYQGQSGDTGTPVGTDSSSFTTPAITVDTDYWVRVSDENGSEDSSTAIIAVPDITPPATIADLSLTSGNSEMELSWTAPGDDGLVRTASSYDIRYSTSPIANDTDFENATQVANAPTPAAPGSPETMTVRDLDPDTRYYFAIKTSDEIPNTSVLSNVPSVATLPFPAYWEAWHNSETQVLNPNDSVVSSGDMRDVTTPLLDASNGSELGVTVTYSYGGNPIDDAGWDAVVSPVADTDFDTFFTGKLAIDHYSTDYTPFMANDKPMEIEFNNLPSGTYEIILSSNRGHPQITDYEMTVENATGYSNVSSAEAIVNNDTTRMVSVNTYKGHVAHWVNITPTGEGGTSFTIKAMSPSTYQFAIPQVIILKRTAPTPAPVILEQPRNTRIQVSQTATLSVSAQSRTAGGGALSYQWYQGERGDMSSPIAGATAATYTTPQMASPGEYRYWVSVADAYGMMDSDTATVTVRATGWEAYHNAMVYAQDYFEERTTEDHVNGTPYTLINFGDGSPLYATVQFNMTGAFNYNQYTSGAVQTSAATDLSNVFDGILTFRYRHSYSSHTSKAVEIVFDDLQAGGLYEVTLGGNSAYATYASSIQDFEILNASGYTNSSSAEVIVNNDTSAIANANTANGYVAQWSNITPTANDGRSFTIRVTSDDTFLMVPQLIKLKCTMAAPMLTTEPQDHSIALNASQTLSVVAVGSSGGALTYQWYEGISGDTATPIAGATSAMYTTPPLTVAGDYHYWVSVSDANGPSHSSTATITVDDAPPAAIADLMVTISSIESVSLAWTAVGNDGTTGTADSYDIRYSTSPILSDTDFEFATETIGEPVPLGTGTMQTFEVLGLAENTTYYFAMKTTDEVGNVSALSNLPSATTKIIPTAWEAWHNSFVESTNPNEALVTKGNTIGMPQRLKDSSNGSFLNATITYTYTGEKFTGYTQVGDADVPLAGTDYDTYFSGKVTMDKALKIDMTDGNAAGITFGNLRPGSYELTLSTNYALNTFTGYPASLILSDATGYTNESSAPVIVDNSSVVIDDINTTPGYVARWTHITPTGDNGTSFTINMSQYLDRVYSVLPAVFILKYTGPSGAPLIGTEPVGSTVNTGSSATMSVNAAASAGQLLFQWYEGASGDTSQPIVGATSESYTSPVYTVAGTHEYWVAVTDDNATVNTASATVTVEELDVTPPSAVSDLSSSAVTPLSVTLSWTAPGDDATTGTATSYDVRYSTSAITNDTDFDAATQASGEPTPSVAGSVQSLTINGLSSITTYYFAIKVADEESNTSALSNMLSVTTPEIDLTAPAAISDLSTSAQSAGSVTLTWTATGDDGANGTATSYDIRYSTSPISNDTDFDNATPATAEPSPLASGSNQSFTVSGLAEDTTYSFAMKVADEASNISALSNVISASTSAPLPPEKSLLFNFGSTASGNWNNFADNSMLTWGSLKTGLTGYIYDDGSAAAGVTMDIVYSAGKSNVTMLGPMTDTHSDDWLTAEASQYAWCMQVSSSTFKFRLNGLPEGEYQIEAYIYQDAGNDSAFEGLNALAGIMDATTTTSSAYSTATFVAGSTGDSKDKIAKWTGIAVSAGQVVEIEINGGNGENTLINAFRISKMQTAAPATNFSSWANSNGVQATDTEDSDEDGINNLLEYAYDLNPNSNDATVPTAHIEEEAGITYLTMTYRRNRDAPDLTYTIESCTDLTSPGNPWATATEASSSVIDEDIDGDGSAELIKVRVNLTDKTLHFLRLKIER